MPSSMRSARVAFVSGLAAATDDGHHPGGAIAHDRCRNAGQVEAPVPARLFTRFLRCRAARRSS